MDNDKKINDIVEQSKLEGWFADERSVRFGAEKMAELKDKEWRERIEKFFEGKDNEEKANEIVDMVRKSVTSRYQDEDYKNNYLDEVKDCCMIMGEWKDQQNAFKHPLGTKVWWTGYSYIGGEFIWHIQEREVIGTRICRDKEETVKQIFLSGLNSYEGENWFDDDYQVVKEVDGTEFYCSGYGGDYLFDTKEEAERCLQWELDYEKKENEDNNI